MPAQPCRRHPTCTAAPRRSARGRIAALLLGAGLLGGAASGHAQVSGSITVASDVRAHGYSVTGEQPAATVELSYDHPSGLYANGSLIASFDDNNRPVVAGTVANVGYAVKVANHTSLDGGYLRTDYRYNSYDYWRPSSMRSDEIYLGAVVHGLAYHAYYSPNFLGYGVSTLYHELAGGVPLKGRLQLTARAGAMLYLDAPERWHLKNDYDWGVGLARPMGRVTLNLTLNGGKSNLLRFYQNRSLDGTKLVGGITVAF